MHSKGGRVPAALLLCVRSAGNRERYAGTEFALTDLVDKSKIEIVCAR